MGIPQVGLRHRAMAASHHQGCRDRGLGRLGAHGLECRRRVPTLQPVPARAARRRRAATATHLSLLTKPALVHARLRADRSRRRHASHAVASRRTTLAQPSKMIKKKSHHRTSSLEEVGTKMWERRAAHLANSGNRFSFAAIQWGTAIASRRSSGRSPSTTWSFARLA